MICDVHVHLAGTHEAGSGNYIGPALRRQFLFRLFAARLGIRADAGSAAADERIRRTVLGWLDRSTIDRAVLLAFDGAYRRDGSPDMARTQLIVGNDFVAAAAARSPKALFGASVHPYRRDALSELERVIERGACLVKWIPAAQGIRVDDPDCIPFYRLMAARGIPLLCHTGREHTLPVADDAADDPSALELALDQGVVVIAAHCGAPLNRREPGFVAGWERMARRHERFYGDLAAFAVPARTRLLGRLTADGALCRKLVYGSDFPALPVPISYLFRVSPRQALRILCTANPFDQPHRILRALGVPDAVFGRAAQLLPIGPAAGSLQPGAIPCRT